jgi:hypothetical protein
MATIERKPLPPPNSKVTPITEADRAEITAGANDVIDHYLNGPGSYFESGTQKPLVSELGDSRVADLKKFRGRVTASMQFADDPHSIMQSVVDLVDRTIQQVEQAAQDNEGRDSILRPLPDTNDPIYVPRAGGNSALPISLRVEGKQPAPVAPAPQAGRPLGIFTGKPMPSWTTPPPLGGLLNDSNASDNNHWFNFPARLVFRNPTPPAPPLQTGSMPERRLGRRTYSVSPASVFGTGTPAVPFVSSDDANFLGGVFRRFAALAGIDPNQPAPPSPDDEPEQADLQAAEAKLSSSGNINDALALYKARMASRR